MLNSLMPAPVSTFCCVAHLMVAIPSAAQAQDDPQAAAQIAPVTTSFVLNGTPLRYGIDAFGEFGATFGDSRDTLPSLNVTDPLTENLVETTDNGVFHRRQTGTYVQGRTVLERQRITTVREEAVDLVGETTQLTVTGRCLLPGSDPDAYCSYTPGLASDPTLLDDDTLVPTGFNVRSEFGGTISEATHDALKAEGFQQTGPDGEAVGLFVDLPNAGLTYSTTRSDLNGIARTEASRSRPVLSFAQVEQNLYSNDASAALDRTIRGAVLLDGDDWTGKAVAFQALAWLLPSHDASLAAGSGDPRLSISNNLFYAANNNRLPENSFTLYHGTYAWGEHARKRPTRASETPVAWAQGVWLGFSPVSEVERTTRLRYIPTGDREVVQETFRQGGVTYELDSDITGRISVLDIATQELAQIDITNIEDLFVQSGGALTTQEAIRQVRTTETTTYSYVPHLSLTGNRTDGTSVLRYYTGAILADETNAYVGFDYALNTEDGLQASFGTTLYSNPTHDYFSQAQASVAKSFSLPAGQLTMGLSGSTEIQRPDIDGTLDPNEDDDNLIDLTAVYREGPATLSVRQRATNVANADRADSTTLSYAYQFSPTFSANSEVTPFSTEDSYFVARAGFSYRFADMESDPVLNVQLARIRYDYGQDNVGGALTDTETTLLATLQMTF